jgi:two-component system sensor histidine kinase TctE
MARLSNQLLSLARAEQGSSSLRKEVVDFGAIARDALESLTPMALSKTIDLGLEGGDVALPVRGHSTLLRELVVNLVDNALRYTSAGGLVTARLARQGDDIVLRVEDSGPGIAPADKERVFERFFRAAGAPSEGTGLGLAIVREIVLSHDGQVELADQAPPPGLIVEVRMPSHRGEPAAAS